VTRSVSAVIPTLNSEKYLDECLASVRSQDYHGKLEIVLVDGGSTDQTLEIARRHSIDQVLENPLQTGEAGKAVGFRAARGELILTMDSDNVLVGTDWLARMVAPFDDPEIAATQALRWDYRRSDHYITRWAALTGVTDPLVLSVGNYDRYSSLTGRWTDYPHQAQERDGWVRVAFEPRWVPAMGANGYIVRREAFECVPVGDYFFDVDFAWELVQRGFRTMGLVDVPIRHYYCDSLGQFMRKTRRRADDYLFFRRTGTGRSYPWTHRQKRGIVRFVASTLVVVPLVVDVARGQRRVRDPAWLFHLPACWITLGVYGLAMLRGHIRPRMLRRTDWRQ
jgi:glycosyltransferase involved in cell wall biosynthesis